MWQHRFETILADTEQSRHLHYKLRYKVFCEETRFEDAAKFADNKEVDHYDQGSVHFLIWDHLTQTWAGAMRLVDGRRGAFPSEAICAGPPLLDLEANHRKAVEFSRLCVMEGYRHTHSAIHFAYHVVDGPSGKTNVPIFFKQDENEILLRMIRAMFGWSQAHDIGYCYFLINAALARVLKRLHIKLTTAGDKIDHRGSRTPYMFDILETEARMCQGLPHFARMVKQSPGYTRYTAFVARKRSVREHIITPATFEKQPSELQQAMHR